MTYRYALLILPSANRVYADAATDLTRAELGVFGRTALEGRIDDIAVTRLGGVPYVTFSTADPLSPRDVSFLSNLSTLYTLFQLRDDGALVPVGISPLDRFDDDLITIQKYAGKTNEQFTKLLLNVTVLASRFGTEMLDRRLHVFDPLCGRGTTLNQALMYGWNATGLDIDAKDFDAYRGFVESWLRRKRLKHRTEVVPVRRERKLVARRMEVSLPPRQSASKEEYKAGDRLTLTVINADTTKVLDFVRPRSFDVVVADAPYGVQHGSRARDDSLSRRPLELLRGAVRGWARSLRPGGALGLSWNAHVAKRSQLADLLGSAGLTVCEGEPWDQFAHRVDQAILRDVIVARLDERPGRDAQGRGAKGGGEGRGAPS